MCTAGDFGVAFIREAWQFAIAARAWPVFADRRPEEMPVEHNLDGSAAGTSRTPESPSTQRAELQKGYLRPPHP